MRLHKPFFHIVRKHSAESGFKETLKGVEHQKNNFREGNKEKSKSLGRETFHKAF
jgi:hypothetical protein